ncbi:MAG: hypothetical protein PVI21_06165 [Candidatus Woesebacteria bacterium]|jgi:hypothetical protein
MIAFSSVRLPACDVLARDGSLSLDWTRCLDSLLVDPESNDLIELSSERVSAIIYALVCIAAEACNLQVGTARRGNLQRRIQSAVLAYFAQRQTFGAELALTRS